MCFFYVKLLASPPFHGVHFLLSLLSHYFFAFEVEGCAIIHLTCQIRMSFAFPDEFSLVSQLPLLTGVWYPLSIWLLSSSFTISHLKLVRLFSNSLLFPLFLIIIHCFNWNRYILDRKGSCSLCLENVFSRSQFTCLLLVMVDKLFRAFFFQDTVFRGGIGYYGPFSSFPLQSFLLKWYTLSFGLL